jgi:hypothetical protein
MPLVDDLRNLDFASLTGSLENASQLLATANVSVTVNGQAEVSVTGILGIQPLVDAAASIPSNPAELGDAVKAMLKELEGLAGIPKLGGIGDVLGQFDGAAGVLRQIAESLGGGPDAVIDRLLGDLGGLDRVVADFAGRLTDSLPFELPDAAKIPVQALTMLAGANLDGAKLADVLARFTFGVELEALRAPSLSMDVSLDAIANVDLGDLEARIPTLTAQVRAILPMLLAPNVNVSATLAALASVRTALDALFADLPQLIGGFAGKLNAIDTTALVAKLTAALDKLSGLAPAVSFGVEDLLQPLRVMAQGIDALTSAQLTASFDELVARIQAKVAESGIDEVEPMLDELFDLLVGQIERIELRQMRDEVIDALHAVEARINRFTFAAPAVLTEQLGKVQEAIAKIDTSAIAARVQEIRQSLEAIVANFPIAAIAEKVGELLDPVANAVAAVVPALEKVDAQLEELGAQLEAIDFESAADDARALMTGIREKVQEALGSGDIPPAAKSALSVAAAGLKQIDFRAEISAPVMVKLDAIDPGILLAPLKPVVDEVRAKVAAVSPEALLAQLEAPFDDLLARLEPFKPSSLVAIASQEFGRVTAVIDAADPRVLVQPLQAEFEQVVQKVRDTAKLDPLFDPLQDLYAELQKLVDLIDLGKLLESLTGKLGLLPKKMAEGAKAAVAAKAGAAQAVAAAAQPFRLGDIIRPFAFLVRDVRTAVGKASDDVIGAALTAVAAPVALLDAVTDPQKGFLAQLGSAIDARMAVFDVNGSGPAGELAIALRELSTAAASLSLGGAAQVQIGGGVASVQLDARLTLIAQARTDLDTAVAKLFERLSPPELTTGLRRASAAIHGTVPAALLELSPEVAVRDRLAAFFDAIDPAPLVAELDGIGEQINARFLAFAEELTQGLFKAIDAIFSALDKVTPAGLVVTIKAGMQRIRDELAVLDPAPIKAEAQLVVDSIINVLGMFSPATLAAQVAVVFDALKAKIGTLDPAALLGDTTVLDKPFDDLALLRPSSLLGGITGKLAEVQAALDALLDLKIGDALVAAVLRLRATIEAILDDVMAEFEDLLAFLEGGGEVSVSVEVTV